MNDPLDQLGNKLTYDDLIQIGIDIPYPYVYGKIIDIKPAGAMLVGGTKGPQKQPHVTAGMLVIQAEIRIPFGPDIPIKRVVKVHEPKKEGPTNTAEPN